MSTADTTTTRPLDWASQENCRPDIQADIVSAGDYVISCRTGRFYLNYRPQGEHHPLGSFRCLQGAKNAAEHHHTLVAP